MNSKKLIFTDGVKVITNEEMEGIFKNAELKFDNLKYIITNKGNRVNPNKNSNITKTKINKDSDRIYQEFFDKEN